MTALALIWKFLTSRVGMIVAGAVGVLAALGMAKRSGRKEAEQKRRLEDAEQYIEDSKAIDESVGGIGDDSLSWLRDRADKRGLRRPDSGSD